MFLFTSITIYNVHFRVSMYGRRIIYCIEEMDPILDSANMSMEDWALIAKLIEKCVLYSLQHV